MHYYNVINLNEEILEGYANYPKEYDLAKDRVLYFMKEERKAALLESGYGIDEIKIIETWIEQPKLK